MNTNRLCGALAALMLIGTTWSQAATAQQIEVPDLKDNIPLPSGEEAPPPEGIEGTPGEITPGEAQIPDAVNTGGWPFIFNIPVSISGLHEDIERAVIECDVYAKGDNVGIGWSATSDIPFDETSRSYDGVVIVRVSRRSQVPADLSPLNANKYRCSLRLYPVNAGRVGMGVSCLNPNETGEIEDRPNVVLFDPDDCYSQDGSFFRLLTSQTVGRIDPVARTATACRTHGFGEGEFVKCR